MLEKGENLEQKTKKTEEFLSFIRDVPSFYKLSYTDLLLIKENITSMPENLISNIGDLDELVKKTEKSYRLGNYHYKQTFSNSCAIACYMMASSNYLKKRPSPNKEMEKAILNNFQNEISITKILQLCLSESLNVRVFSELDYREKKKKEKWAEALRKNFLDFYKENSENPKIQFNFNKPLEEKSLKNLLMNGEAILVNGLVYDIPHMRVVSGYDEDDFLVSDPLEYRKSQMSFSNLNEQSKPPLGQFFFSLTSKKIDGE